MGKNWEPWLRPTNRFSGLKKVQEQILSNRSNPIIELSLYWLWMQSFETCTDTEISIILAGTMVALWRSYVTVNEKFSWEIIYCEVITSQRNGNAS